MIICLAYETRIRRNSRIEKHGCANFFALLAVWSYRPLISDWAMKLNRWWNVSYSDYSLCPAWLEMASGLLAASKRPTGCMWPEKSSLHTPGRWSEVKIIPHIHLRLRVIQNGDTWSTHIKIFVVLTKSRAAIVVSLAETIEVRYMSKFWSE